MEVKDVCFVRHAKSSWDQPGLKDFDRPLDSRGLHDAPMMARKMKAFALGLLAMLLLGFSSGLPLYLLLNLVPAWLRSEGVDLKTIGDFFKAGVVAVGVGSSLISKDVLDKDDWATLTKTAAAFVAAAKAARG